MPEDLRKIKTFEFTVSISGVMDVPYAEWPASITDGIEQALERLSEREQLPVAVVVAEYKRDLDFAPDAPGHHYIHVIASEVIAADARAVSPRRLLDELPSEIKALMN